MRFSLLALVTCSLVVLTACEKPCPKGQQRYGAKCVMSPVYDAGLDGVDAGGDHALGDAGAPNDSTMDGGDLASCVPPACHPCDQDPCGTGGVCSETDTSFECACKVGFSGKRCQVDVCELDPCAHGECVRRASGRECKCESGWTGESCDVNTDASLAGLSVSAGALFPAFKPNVYAYSVDLGISSPEIAVTPVAAVPKGVNLSVGTSPIESGAESELYALELNASKVISIAVSAEDGTKAIYKITVRRSLVQQAYVKAAYPKEGDYFGGGQLAGDLFLGLSVAVSDGLLAVGSSKRSKLTFFDQVTGEWQRRTDAEYGPTDAHGFGFGVAMSSRWLAAAAPSTTDSASSTIQSGMAYVYERGAGGLAEPITLWNPSPAEYAGFGTRVAIAGNSIAVGAFNDGKVHVFRYDNGWDGEPVTISKPVGVSGMFGPALAIEGNLVAVGGADRDSNKGAVFVYDISSGEAEQVGYLSHPSLEYLGVAVGISEGRVAVAGGGSEALQARKVVVYQRSGQEWVAGEPFGIVGDGQAFATHGLVFQGNRILVGASNESGAGSGVYAAPSNTTAKSESGAAYLFVERSDGWHLDAYLKAGTSVEAGHFGMGVSMDGDTIAITEPGDSSSDPPSETDTSVPNSGAVYVFGPNCANVPAGAAVPGC